jgi:chromosome segregation ATPase
MRLKARLDARSRGDELPPTLIDAARAFYAHALQVGAAKTPAAARDDREALKVELDRVKSQLRHAERELEEQREQRALLFEAAGRTHASLVEAQALAQHCAAQARELQAKLDAAQRELGATRSTVAMLRAKLTLRTRTARKPKTPARTTATGRSRTRAPARIKKR